MKHKFQISESIRLGAILALSGGFMDAYSYMERGEVFANAQTGNMLLFGVHLSQGDFQNTMKYLFPVLAFALGIALAEVVRAKAGNLLHWRQISVGRSTDPDRSQFLPNSIESSGQCINFFCLWNSG